jgi:hypothetical protein
MRFFPESYLDRHTVNISCTAKKITTSRGKPFGRINRERGTKHDGGKRV